MRGECGAGLLPGHVLLEQPGKVVASAHLMATCLNEGSSLTVLLLVIRTCALCQLVLTCARQIKTGSLRPAWHANSIG